MPGSDGLGRSGTEPWSTPFIDSFLSGNGWRTTAEAALPSTPPTDPGLISLGQNADVGDTIYNLAILCNIPARVLFGRAG